MFATHPNPFDSHADSLDLRARTYPANGLYTRASSSLPLLAPFSPVSPSRNKVRITWSMHHRVAPPAPVLFFYYATFTRENNARAHFTRVIWSPDYPRAPPPLPLFAASCSGSEQARRGGEGDRRESSPADASYADVAI